MKSDNNNNKTLAIILVVLGIIVIPFIGLYVTNMGTYKNACNYCNKNNCHENNCIYNDYINYDNNRKKNFIFPTIDVEKEINETRNEILKNIEQMKDIEEKQMSEINKITQMNFDDVKGKNTTKVKIYTEDVKDGKGKIYIEYSNNNKEGIYKFDIKYNNTNWEIVDNGEMINEEDMEMINKVKEILKNQSAKNISLNYSYNSVSAIK